MKVILRCEICNTEIEQTVDGLFEIDWMCPNCKCDDDVYMIDHDCEPGEVNLGNGGCGRQRSW